MAKQGETVTVPVEVLERMQARLDELERQTRSTQESLLNSRQLVIDPDYAAWKAEASRPASERSQDAADRKYGKANPRFRVRLDATTEDGKKGPNISEHFPLEVSANSDLEAGARYLELMGIRKHDYRVVAEPLAAAA